VEVADIRRRVGEAPRAGSADGAFRKTANPPQMSGGQQQTRGTRPAAPGPEACRVLLLDEPLGAPGTRNCAKAAPKSSSRPCSRRWASPSIYVTHDQEEALTMSDRIAVMSHGLGRTSGGRRSRSTRSPPPSSSPIFLGVFQSDGSDRPKAPTGQGRCRVKLGQFRPQCRAPARSGISGNTKITISPGTGFALEAHGSSGEKPRARPWWSGGSISAMPSQLIVRLATGEKISGPGSETPATVFPLPRGTPVHAHLPAEGLARARRYGCGQFPRRMTPPPAAEPDRRQILARFGALKRQQNLPARKLTVAAWPALGAVERPDC